MSCDGLLKPLFHSLIDGYSLSRCKRRLSPSRCSHSYWKWQMYSWFTYQEWWNYIVMLVHHKVSRVVNFHVSVSLISRSFHPTTSHIWSNLSLFTRLDNVGHGFSILKWLISRLVMMLFQVCRPFVRPPKVVLLYLSLTILMKYPRWVDGVIPLGVSLPSVTPLIFHWRVNCSPVSWRPSHWQRKSPVFRATNHGTHDFATMCFHIAKKRRCIATFAKYNWLVVGPPLWKIWKSIGMMIFPTEWENKTWQPNHQPVIISCDIPSMFGGVSLVKFREIWFILPLSVYTWYIPWNARKIPVKNPSNPIQNPHPKSHPKWRIRTYAIWMDPHLPSTTTPSLLASMFTIHRSYLVVHPT